MHFRTLEVGKTMAFAGRRITVLPASHTVPAVGYQIDSGNGSLVFTGDTGINDDFWPEVNAIENLKVLIIETAFPNAQRQLALASKHLCPDLLAAELARLTRQAEIFITHLKPGQIEETMAEIETVAAMFRPRMLQNNEVFDF